MSHRIMPALLLLAFVVAGAHAQDPNLTYKYDSSRMEYPFTPTTAFPATMPITVPTSLPGNSNVIYWNILGENNGAASTPGGYGGRVFLDGADFSGFGSATPINAGGIYAAVDKGPFTVRGGRHTLGVYHDFFDEVFESNEGDNWWAHQFMFSPYELGSGTIIQSPAPPVALGGTDLVVDGSLVYWNCDGYRINSSGWWNAVTMYATDDYADYDLEIFNPSTGPESGFINPFHGSYEIFGELDAIIVNRNTVGVHDYDIGVQHAVGAGDFVIEHVMSGPAGVGAQMIASFANNESLKIWDTYIGQAGWVTVTVVDSLQTGMVFTAGWLNHDTTVTNLAGTVVEESSDADGIIRFHFNAPAVGYYGLMVYRDPTQGSMAADLTVIIEPTPPDLYPKEGHHWYAPLVPQPEPSSIIGSPTSLPDTLHGYVPETYLNIGVGNFSPVDAPSAHAAVYFDGMDYWLWGLFTPALIPYGVWTFSDPSGSEYPGGRHTLILELDDNEAIHEIREDNNIHGEQFCWSPMEIPLGGQYSKGYPGPATGGIMTVDPGETFHYNCDGYRLHAGFAPWEGVVLTQGPTSDYDLAVHYPLEGVKNGFDDYRSGSIEMEGHTDYVVFNNSQLGPQVHDIGVMNWMGSDSYTVEAVASATLPIPPTGTNGPFHMGISHMLHLHDIYLEQDLYAFRLDNLYGTADWSMALHAHDEPLPVRAETMSGGSSNQRGPGGSEWFTVDIQVASYYCLAVCKATPLDFDYEGEYELTILRGVSDVPDETPELPTATALSGIHPNPFNPQTTISFELAEAADVDLAVYDVKGALVRRLVEGGLPAGRHTAVWDGRDEAGSRAASGVYLARFRAGSHSEIEKMVMVK